MGQSSSIQFRGIPAIILSYDSRAVDLWSIWQGKQFMFKGSGRDELISVLDALEQGATQAVYTLKVYEDLDDVTKVKSSTPDDGSFNFRLAGENMELVPGAVANHNKQTEILIGRIEALSNRFDEMEAEPEPEANSLGKIGDILNHPAIVPVVPLLIEKIMAFVMGSGSGTPANQPQQRTLAPVAAIAGITEDQKIYECIARLKLHDPLLHIHLEKLCDIAEKSPEIFKALINNL